MVKETSEEEKEGLSFEPTPGEMKPPLGVEGFEGAEGEEALGKEEIAPAKVKAPLHPAVPKLVFAAEGNLLAEATKYEGWRYTDQELELLAQVICDLGLEIDPKWQALISVLLVHSEKFAGYIQWRRGGKRTEGAKQEPFEKMGPKGKGE